MAHRHSRHFRVTVLTLVTLGALGAAAVVPSLAAATPGHAAPTVASVQSQLNALMRQNSQLVSAFDEASTEVKNKQKAADEARVTAAAAAVAFDQARQDISATVAAQYEGGAFSSAGALLTSDSGQSYLDQLNTLGMIADHNAAVAKQLDQSRAAADAATKQAAALLKAATQRRDALAKQKLDLDQRFDTYRKLLAKLTAQQQAAYQHTLNAPVSAQEVSLIKTDITLSSNVSPAAKKAVQFAFAQLGKPYIYGAAGPDAFDCSGLTMAAYASAGIQLPHSAADQYNYGTHVSLDQLIPGDLIFYYQPIGHVVIYIGGGQAISASTEGVPIGIINIGNWDASQITGATRIAPAA